MHSLDNLLIDVGPLVEGASELPSEARAEETSHYTFGNPLFKMDTVVDNSTPLQLIHETGVKKPASATLRGLALSLRGPHA